MSRARWMMAGLGVLLGPAAAGAPGAVTSTWAAAFGDVQGGLHLQATYPDAQGRPQPLEFWRDARGQVVRRTAQRAELRLTPSADGEDLYQLRNLVNRTAFNVHRVNLYRIGVFTDRWSVQHLLDRPAGRYTLTSLNRRQSTPAGVCAWWSVALAAGGRTQVCWSATLGVPLILKSGGRPVLTVTRVLPPGALPSAALPAGWQAYDADEDLSPD